MSVLVSNLPNCRAAGLTCIPLVAETLGGLAEDFISTIKIIDRSIRLRSGTDRPTPPNISLAESVWLCGEATRPC